MPSAHLPARLRAATVWENAALCAEAEIAYQLLASCGMADLANQQASTLSGGQYGVRNGYWKA
jgi:ABC-type phosphate/phosphonate transport system ATPase subunit